MAKIVIKKVKLIIILIIGALIAGGAMFYQKFFGGKALPLAKDEFLVKPETDKMIQIEEKIIKEKIAIAYNESPAMGIREVIVRTGNLDFIKPGQKVLIKPNVNSDDPAPGTTHPETVGELVRLAKEKGAYVIVADRSNARWDTIEAMKKLGIYQAAEQAGADEIIGFEDGDWMRVKPAQATSWPNGFRVPKLLTEVDHIINLPVLHTHFITSHSLALKNLVGLIHSLDRAVFHASKKRDEMIVEISLAIKPSLNVIEGTKAFIKGGPFEGEIINSKVYLASSDILAAEIAGIVLLKKYQAELFWDDPWQARQVKRAVELDLDSLPKKEIEEIINEQI